MGVFSLASMCSSMFASGHVVVNRGGQSRAEEGQLHEKMAGPAASSRYCSTFDVSLLTL